MKTFAKMNGLGPLAALLLLALSGCATQPPYDYAAFKAARPASILVLPPVNHSPDIKGSFSMMSQSMVPLAESGYYVFPVTLVDETFKQNGLTVAEDIHAVPLEKLRKIFGTDAVLYIDVKSYGTSYAVLASETRVTAEARLVDARSGVTLWNGTATASSAEGDNNSGGLLGMLVKAAVRQIIETVSDHGHTIAGMTAGRLLGAGRPNGMLYGPRSPRYMKDGQPPQ